MNNGPSEGEILTNEDCALWCKIIPLHQNYKSMRIHILTAFIMATITSSATPSADQAITQTTALDSSRVYDIDEVTVVRQSKDRFLLRRQPISSTMLSAAELDAAHVTDLRGAATFVPNFVMPKYGSRYTSAMYVRGIGSRVNSPAVGIYSDGMPLIGKSAFNTRFHDIARIDVMRGPQGTLYGLNTEGGLVRIYTRNPLTDPGTEIRVGAGTYSSADVDVTTRHRLSDKVGMSLSAFYSADGGFLTNSTLGTDADKSQEAGARMKWVIAPTANSYVNILADYQYTHQNAFPYGELNTSNGHLSDPSTNHDGKYRRNILNAAVEAGFKLGDMSLVSTTSYQHLYDFMTMDIDYMPQDFMLMTERQRQNAITQELVLKNNDRGMWRWTTGIFGSQQWLHTNAPVYFNSDMDRFLSENIRKPMYAAMLNSFTQRFVGQGMPYEAAQQAAATAIERAGGVSVDADMNDVPGIFDTPTLNLGLFHETTLLLSSRLSATLGLRYDWNRTDIDYQTSAAMDCAVSVMGRTETIRIASSLSDKAHRSWGQLLPKLALAYTIDGNNSNLYATIAKGYRAGGFNIQMFSDILQMELSSHSNSRQSIDIEHTGQDYQNIISTISYEPETSWNYELGTHLNLPSGRIRIDAAAYLMQVRNQQLSVMAGTYGFGRMMVNAGRTTSYGLEVSLRGHALSDRLTYSASYGFTHATFRHYTDSLQTADGVKAVDYRGRHVPFVPQHTFACTADWLIPLSLAPLRSLTVGASVSGQGRTWWDEANTVSQKAYATLGSHLLLDFGRVTVDIWGTNLTNSRHATFAVGSQATGTTRWFAQKSQPIRFGADLRVRL